MTTRGLTLFLLLLLGLQAPGRAAPVSHSQAGTTFTNDGEFVTHASNTPLFGTPLVTGDDGAIYVCYIDPDLATVVRRKDPQTDAWSEPAVVAPQTRNDPYHTQCSLGIDASGYLHVVYNMHSTPWQYSRSTQPGSVAAWTFLGQYAGERPGSSTTADSQCTGQCATDWVTDEPGLAAIPGNQITYPTFGYGAEGTLYLAFRECFDCDAGYHARQWSGGMVRYDVTTKTWTRLGGVRPWATDPAMVAMGLRLHGDARGRLHASWIWCPHYTQAEGGQACFGHPNHVTYAMSDDRGTTWRTSSGAPIPLPLRPGATEVVLGPEWFDAAGAPGYFAGNTRLTASPQSEPFIVVFPRVTTTDEQIVRSPVRFRGGAWSAPAALAYSPSLVYPDGRHPGTLRAVSSGLRIHTSLDDGTTWTLEELDTARGPYTFAHDARYLRGSGHLRLYANNAAQGLLVIWTVQFPAPPPVPPEAARCYSTLVKIDGEQVGSILREEPCP